MTIMTNRLTLPIQSAFSNTDIIQFDKANEINQQFYYFCLKISISIKKELKTQLTEKLDQKLSKRLTKKLKKSLNKLESSKNGLSGIIKLSTGRNVFKMFHYLLRMKGKSKNWIELFLVNITEEFNLIKVMKKLFDKNKKQYRQDLKVLLTKNEVTYLKLIGKGIIDYDIEKRLKYSRVELIGLKQHMTKKLELRNENELYWLCQRAGYAKR